MPFTAEQIASAEESQLSAATDDTRFVRLVAGPGTGKSKTIEKRVAYVLENGTPGTRVAVISFTRATCQELASRLKRFCAIRACADESLSVRVSTMHALALRILRRGNLLNAFYPSDPVILDEWESTRIYDEELAHTIGVSPGRAAEIRIAHDARWQTLDPSSYDQAAISEQERNGSVAFHVTRSNLYSSVLPGELIFKCVGALEGNHIAPEHLPAIEQLIVDEFQDLNACDQRFIELLVQRGATLFIAGDDDQSIYSFRHADPSGIVRFDRRYEGASTHTLTDCFRCTPAIVAPAIRLIAHNANRLPKQLDALYEDAAPPVEGRLLVWSFPTPEEEARAIALSCRMLIQEGMQGHENEILVLVSDRRLQLDVITTAFQAAGVPFDLPSGIPLADDDAARSAYCMLRILKGEAEERPDYIAHRAFLSVMRGVGIQTQRQVGDLCVQHNQNYRDLFYLENLPAWLIGRPRRAVERVMQILQRMNGWSLDETLEQRAEEMISIVGDCIFGGGDSAESGCERLRGYVHALRPGMLLSELLDLFSARTELELEQVLQSVDSRLDGIPREEQAAQRRVRILTMHGAKGLSGKVVFIPSLEQGIMPSMRAVNAAGLLIEARRLFYVSLTRAMAACIISHASLRTGASARRIAGSTNWHPPRSQFLAEMNLRTEQREGGLAQNEARDIIADVQCMG